jgi:hypothetical protein
LLSKHNGDLRKELRLFRLETLFDGIIHLPANANKFEYIKSPHSLFIDDSHAERKSIKAHLNIPVFSPDMIDVLM